MRGQILLAGGALDEVEQLSSLMVERFSEDPLSLDLRGRVLFLRGRLEELKFFAVHMISVLPDSPRGFNLLAAACTQLELRDKALGAQRHALELAPDDPETIHNTWKVLEWGGKAGEAGRLEERFREMDLEKIIEKSRIGEREDKLFWLREGMRLFP